MDAGAQTSPDDRTEDPTATDAVDGRTARRDRNRTAVLDAVLELFAEDAMTPAPADVAARSGVSLRSVYRYFEDMEALVRAAMARHLERVQPSFAVDGLGEGELHERIDRLVAQRLRLYEVAAPVMRAALVRASSNEQIDRRLVENRARLRTQTAAMFARELDDRPEPERTEVLEALDVLLGFEAVDHLRVRRALDDADVARVIARAVRGTLATVAGSSDPS